MFCRNLLVLLFACFAFVQAQLLPRATLQATPIYANTSQTSSVSQTTPACCFIVQDTVSEAWWEESSYSTTHNVVNLTSFTTYVTAYPNITSIRIVTNIYTTNATFNYTHLVGVNPISMMTNDAPNPSETHSWMNGTVESIVTAGVTIQSPAAFYIYSTIKVITAAPITDAAGELACGTVSSFSADTPLQDIGTSVTNEYVTLSNINTNAQAYFGGPGIVGFTQVVDDSDLVEVKFYTNSKGKTVTQTSIPTGVIISLTTPFIYQPARGAAGETGNGEACLQSGGSENWGYVPRTLIDYLVSNDEYSAQYPGLASCLPGGPSVLRITACSSALPEWQSNGNDLTSSTVVYVEAPIAATTTASMSSSVLVLAQSQVSSSSAIPAPVVVSSQSTSVPPTSNQLSSTSQPAVSVAPVSSSAASIQPAAPASSSEPTPAASQSSTSLGAIIASMFGNSLSSTPIPVTTIPLPSLQPGETGITTIISSSTYVIIPTASPQVINIPATTIPLSLAPSGLSGKTSTISGTLVLIISSATTLLPTASSLFSTTIISGSPYIIIPSSTEMPLSLAPSGLTGATTTISGSPYLVITSAATIPIPTPTPTQSFPGDITVISGTTEVVISGLTTIPVNSQFSIQGSTEVVSGTTMVVVGGKTTVPFSGTGTGLAKPSYVQNSGGNRPTNIRIGWMMGSVGFIVGLAILG